MTASVGETLLTAQLQQAGAPAFRREYKFHPTRRWRIDFAWPDHRLAVEVEGATWTRGRHTRGSGYRKDLEKYNSLALAGWRVIRVPTDWVTESTTALDLILQALEATE